MEKPSSVLTTPPSSPPALYSTDPMRSLRVVLVRSRFPENIGAAARASANFGHASIHMVAPERWEAEHQKKAHSLATGQGITLLEQANIYADLAPAVAPCSLVIGTTARIGGWRKALLRPEQAAAMLAQHLIEGQQCALVFGSEDRGLENKELRHCTHVVSIPTDESASSLNLGQAVLLMLYECFKSLDPNKSRGDSKENSRRVSQEERERFYGMFKQCLLDIGYLQPQNPEYFFLPLAHFFHRADLRRHEMDIFLGICRQMQRFSKLEQEKESI